MVSIICCVAALITAHGYSLKSFELSWLLGRVVPKAAQPLPLALQSCFCPSSSRHSAMRDGSDGAGLGHSGPISLSVGWEGAIKARIWPLGAELPHSLGTTHRLGRKQGKLGSMNWLRHLKYKFPGFHGRVHIHMYSALFWSYLIQWRWFLSFREQQMGPSGIS